jgi:toxin CptA
MPPLRITPNPSGTLRFLVGAGHGLAMLAVALTDISWIWTVPLAFAILASVRYEVRRMVSAEPWTLLHVEGQGWSIARPGGEPEGLTLSGSSVATPWVVVLHGRTGRRRRDLLVTRDSLDAESFRRLRLHLRIFHRDGLK